MADLPTESRGEVVDAVRPVVGVDVDTAEALIRAAEPLWDAMERPGGLVDSWGGRGFCHVFLVCCRSSERARAASERRCRVGMMVPHTSDNGLHHPPLHCWWSIASGLLAGSAGIAH